MRNRWGRGPSGGRSGRRADQGQFGSPYDFSELDAAESADETQRLDPVDIMAIRADDELLDLLAAGGPAPGPRRGTPGRPMGSGPNVPGPRSGYGSSGPGAAGPGAGFNDEQQLFAMLAAWRADVHSEPFPELVSVAEASEAIVSGQRAATRGKRRLMPVAAAAAVVVLGMTGVWAGASTALPGDPLWGVSRVINSDRANSVDAQYRVTSALTAAERALSEGRVSEARAKLAEVQPDLAKVHDRDQHGKLSRRSENLRSTAEESREGEKIDLDESGSRKDRDTRRRESSSGGSGSESSESSGSESRDPDRPGHDPSILRDTDSSRPSQEAPFPGPMPKPFPGSEGPGGFPIPGRPNPLPGSEKPHPTPNPAPEENKPYPFPGGGSVSTNPANPGVPFPGSGNNPYPFPGPMPFPQQSRPAPQSGEQHPDRGTRPAPSTRPSQEAKEPSGGERTRPNSEHTDRRQPEHQQRREQGSGSGSGSDSGSGPRNESGPRNGAKPENDSGSGRGSTEQERQNEPRPGNGGR